jgi:hypothetical protein
MISTTISSTSRSSCAKIWTSRSVVEASSASRTLMRVRDWRDEMVSLTSARPMNAGNKIGSRASVTCQRTIYMARLRNVHVYTHHVERKWSLKARRKRRPVRFEPLPREETSSFTFGGRGIGYGERFDNWEVFLLIIPNGE